MGDFGGCTEILVLFFGMILYPVSEFSFKLKALKKLFKIKSENKKMFVKNDDGSKLKPR